MHFSFDRNTRTVRTHTAAIQVSGSNGLRLHLDGRVYYHRAINGTKIIFGKDPASELLQLIDRTSIENIINTVEGDYSVAVHDRPRNRISFSKDKLGRQDIYYYGDSERIIIADSLAPFTQNRLPLDYDADALVSSLAMCIPKKHTLFLQVKRLRYNEILHVDLTTGAITIQVVHESEIRISDYGPHDLGRYKDILETAILSRASSDLNVVQASGGYDSTLLLAVLRQELGKKYVKSCVFQVTIADGRVINPYEVDKAIAIGSRLDVETEVVDVDVRNPALAKMFIELLPELKANQLFTVTTNQYRLATELKRRYGNDVTVFNGEGCDSLHNFGFSQFVSIPHSNPEFAEYADNMKTWLFGPEFFKKVLDGSFISDAIYQLFRSRFPRHAFVEPQELDHPGMLIEFLMSFIMSDLRLPFRRIEPLFMQKSYEATYRASLNKDYFANIAAMLNPENLYYYYSILYTDFHLQGPEIRRLSTSLPGMKLPFLDSDMFRYLAAMPQSFGRGLGRTRNKHPLKELIRDSHYGFPLDIVERPPHSYLADVETGLVNTDDEYLLKSDLAGHLRRSIDLERLASVYCDRAFQVDSIYQFLDAYKRGQVSTLSPSHARAVLQAAILCNDAR